jgi:hypothetical protein
MASGSSVSDMGELFIQRPGGRTSRYLIDGSVIEQLQGLTIDWCDKCDKWKPLEGGYYVQSDGLAMIWLCQECK